MRALAVIAAGFVVGVMSVTAAEAACSGSNGRGWGSGNGNGKFQMSTSDKVCNIDFAGFINDKTNTRIPATKVTVTRAPKSGKVTVTGKGLTYTPNKGFKGSDKFCTRNTSPKVPGQTLSGCITVAVQ